MFSSADVRLCIYNYTRSALSNLRCQKMENLVHLAANLAIVEHTALVDRSSAKSSTSPFSQSSRKTERSNPRTASLFFIVTRLSVSHKGAEYLPGASGWKAWKQLDEIPQLYPATRVVVSLDFEKEHAFIGPQLREMTTGFF